MIPARLTPWPHQAAAFEVASSRAGTLLAMEMGTGKSAVAAWMLAADRPRLALISCPVSVLDVWPRQLEMHSAIPCHVEVLRKGSVADKLRQAKAALDVRWEEPLVLVIGHESLWREPFGPWALTQQWGLVVIDESHRGSGSPGGKSTRYLGRLAGCAARRLALTGTPLSSGIISAYCQGRFVDARVFGQSATLFRATYPIEDHVALRLDEGMSLRVSAPYQVTEVLQRFNPRPWFDRGQREWVFRTSDAVIAGVLTALVRQPLVMSPELEAICRCEDYPLSVAAFKLCRPLQLDAVRLQFATRLGSMTYRCEARDVLDLPEEIHEVRYCDLEPAAMRVYRSLEQELIAELDAGVVSASNALVKLLRLQQLTAGVLATDDGVETVVSTAKAELLHDVLEDLAEPVVVFSRFRSDLDQVESVAAEMGRTYGELSGRRRDGLDGRGMMAEVDVLGAQLQAGGVGVDLTRSHVIIDYSPGYSLADYLQSGARQCRPGQRAPRVFRLHLVARGTIDEEVYAALSHKQDAVDAVVKRLGRRAA